jgi:hypothetical protein
MVIGRGDIAKVIKDREGFIFYASGNSNRHPFKKSIVREFPPDNMFVYFSTLSIYYSDSEYTKHKLEEEAEIKAKGRNYCIIRIGNITWGDNPNTLLNYLKAHPEAERQDTFRYLIDQDELNHWLGMIPRYGKHEMNITGKRVNVKDL